MKNEPRWEGSGLLCLEERREKAERGPTEGKRLHGGQLSLQPGWHKGKQLQSQLKDLGYGNGSAFWLSG